ncbi:MAG TPA: hypothetical protein VH134_01320 [Candidatus Dormibacteraeota bacterium]|nr:hypothetical protein [Candidatus Dormibacteraeota bacterium]
MHQRSPLRTAWALATIGGATAVGITTQRPGFVVITFIGGLLLPRVLGFGWAGHHGHHAHARWHGCHGGHAQAQGGAVEEKVTA